MRLWHVQKRLPETSSQAEWCIEKSSELAKQVEEAEDRNLILEDLKTIL